MSYSTMDRYGDLKTTFVHHRGGAPPDANCIRTWWPDFGPGSQDFSQQRRSHPSEGIFESVVEPKRWSHEGRPASMSQPALAEQFRNPAPARHAMLHKTEPEVEQKLAVHSTNQRQEASRRLHRRSRKMAERAEAPVRMVSAYAADDQATARRGGRQPPRSLSAPAAQQAMAATAPATREAYERQGWLVGRSQGSIADGRSGEAPRRHHPLSYHAMRFSGDAQDKRRSPGKPFRKSTGQLRCTTAPSAWNFCPDPLAAT